MKRALRVLPDAEAELQSAAIWYEERRRGLGIEFVAVVEKALQSVSRILAKTAFPPLGSTTGAVVCASPEL